MRTIAIRVGFFVLIGIGALVLRPFLTGGVGDLKVGECFDEPAMGQTIQDVQHHPCTDAHSAEVFYIGKHAAPDDAPYPTVAALSMEAETACTPVFDAYTGLTFTTDPTWTFGLLYPVASGWAEGDRGFICYATRIDSAPSTTSIKKA